VFFSSVSFANDSFISQFNHRPTLFQLQAVANPKNPVFIEWHQGWASRFDRLEIVLYVWTMKKIVAIFWLVCALSACAAPLGIVVPAYFHSESLWTNMNWAAGRVPLVAIMNPNSGPGTTRNLQYVAAVNSLRSAGGKVIGYVSTDYAKRPAAAVREDIDRYCAFYTLDGIFLDEFTNDSKSSHLAHYGGLYQYIRSKGTNMIVMGNPGTHTQEAYLAKPCADVLVTFESGRGYSNYVADAWVMNHPARQFCHLPYAVGSTAGMTNFVNLAVARNAGWIYVTSDSGSNPWDTLPVYWTNEVNYIQELNKGPAAGSNSTR
jgi:hypothetical protein